MIVGDYARRTPGLRNVSKELAELAVHAVAEGMDFPYFAEPDMFGVVQSPKEHRTAHDFLADDSLDDEYGRRLAMKERGPVDDYGRIITPELDEQTLPPDLATEDDLDMLTEIQDVVPQAPLEDLYTVARHLKVNAPTKSGIDVNALPPAFTEEDALEDLVTVKQVWGPEDYSYGLDDDEPQT